MSLISGKQKGRQRSFARKRTQQNGDVFQQAIDAARSDGLSLEDWLRNAVRNSDQRDSYDPSDDALANLARAHRQSQYDAERITEELEKSLLQETTPQPETEHAETSATSDSNELLSAISDLSEQIHTLKRVQASDQQPFSAGTPNQENQTGHAEQLLERIAGLKDRLHRLREQSVNMERAQAVQAQQAAPRQAPEARDEEVSNYETVLASADATEEEIFADVAQEEMLAAAAEEEVFDNDDEPALFETTADPIVRSAEPKTAEPSGQSQLDASLEQHFSSLGDRISALLERREQDVREQDQSVIQKMENSLQSLEQKVGDLPRKQDISRLEPVIKKQTQIQQHNARIFDALNDRLGSLEEFVRSNKAEPTDWEQKIDQIGQQISTLASSINNPSDVDNKNAAGLLDLAVQKLEKSIQINTSESASKLQQVSGEKLDRLEGLITQQADALETAKGNIGQTTAKMLSQVVERLEGTLKPSDADQNGDALAPIAEKLTAMEKAVAALPDEVASKQPNAQSLVSFLPSRKTLEGMEHTIGRIEGLLVKQSADGANKSDDSDIVEFKSKFDDLLSRLDDAMRSFDAASLNADQRAKTQLNQLGEANDALVGKLMAQIERLEEAVSRDGFADTEQEKSVEIARSISDAMAPAFENIESQLVSLVEQTAQFAESKETTLQSDMADSQREAILGPVLDAIEGLSAEVVNLGKNAGGGAPANADNDVLNNFNDTLISLVGKVESIHEKLSSQQIAESTKVLSANSKRQTSRETLSDASISTETSSQEPKFSAKAKVEPAETEIPPLEPKFQEVIPPRPTAKPAADRQALRETDEDEKAAKEHPKRFQAGADFVSIARRARSERLQDAAPSAKTSLGEKGRKKKSNDRKKGISWPKSKDRPAIFGRTSKMVLASLGLIAVVSIVVIMLQERENGAPQDTSANEVGSLGDVLEADPIVTGSVNKTSTGLLQGEADNAPRLLPQGNGSLAMVKDDAPAPLSGQNLNPLLEKVALPISRPEREDDSLYMFVAPAPAASIGPIALRYRATTGDRIAQFEVASRYADGFGVRPDLAKAAEWYRRAAEQGLAPAQYRLGSMLEHGTGVPEDKNAAAALYREAAQSGNLRSMYNLGVLHAGGFVSQSGQPDFEQALAWFNKAAEGGLRDAQFNLAVLFARGVGTDVDTEKAYKWFSIAAKSGDEDADAKMHTVKSSLSDDAIARVETIVGSWKPKSYPREANVVDMPAEGWIDLAVPPAAKAQLQKLAGIEEVEENAQIGNLANSDLSSPNEVIESRFNPISPNI